MEKVGLLTLKLVLNLSLHHILLIPPPPLHLLLIIIHPLLIFLIPLPSGGFKGLYVLHPLLQRPVGQEMGYLQTGLASSSSKVKRRKKQPI